MNMQQTCDPDRLDAFVRGELSEQQESELTAHLDQCAACGEELERRVAAADQWREAGELLTHVTRRSNVVDLVKDPSASGSLTTSTAFAEQMDLVVGMLAPTDDPEMLGRIGSYEVSGVIGCGGMGVVFKAHDRSLDRVVAIKVMAPHLAGSGAARKRFARESKAAAAVLHPNVIAIHCVADDPKLPYLVMPYIGGTSLQKRIEADGPLCTQDTLRIGQQIAAGLAAAHAQGLVHRDIKPANILLERGVERVTITDFGLARAVDDATMTRSGVIAGTPQYMSPEQARGESIDHRSDLFSLGSVLYMMCAGHSPFRAETTFGILRRITDNQPRPIREINSEVPEWLCAIIEKLHAKEPSERFQSAEEVAQLLESCLAHVQQPTSVPVPASLVPLTTTGRSVFNVTRKGVLMMLGILGMTLLGMVLWQATEPPDISGQWTGDEWGTVVLEAKGPGQYEGTFTDSFKGQSAEGEYSGTGGGKTPDGTDGVLFGSPGLTDPGKSKSRTLHLKWSRVERRFNGTWKSGENRNGKMSLRLVDNEIRGAWTTNKGTQKEPASPRLADLRWKRNGVADNVHGEVYGERKAYEDPDSGTQHNDKKLPRTVTLYVRYADYHGGPFAPGDYVDVYQTRRNYDHEPWREWHFFKNVKILSTTPVVDASIDNGSAWRLEVKVGADSYVTEGDMVTMLPLYEKLVHEGRVRWIVRPAKSKPSSEKVSDTLDDSIIKVTQANANTPEEEKAKVEAAKAWLRSPIVGSTNEATNSQTNVEVRPVFADIDGEVHEILIGDNSVVTKGQLLLRIRNSELQVELSKTSDQTNEANLELERLVKKLQDNKDLPVEEVEKAERERSELQKRVLTLSEQMTRLNERCELLSVKSTVAGTILTKDVQQLLRNRPVVAGQVLLEIAVEPSRKFTETSSDSLEVRTDERFGIATLIKPMSLRDAVTKFNQLAKEHPLGRQQPELTVEEMTAAFREWIARKECTEATRKDFQQVLDTQMLRPGHTLLFDTEFETEGHLFEVWSIQFGDDKSYAWFKIREIRLRSRLKTDEERKAWEQRIDHMKKSFRESKLRGGTPNAHEAGKPVQLAPIVIPNNSRPPENVQRQTKNTSIVGHWKVAKLAHLPANELEGATVVIDKGTIKMHVPSQKGPHPHWRYTTGADGEIDLNEFDDAKGDTTSYAKFLLEGKTLYLAVNAKKGDYPRPESARGEPQDGVLYIVLELDELASSNRTVSATDGGDEKLDGKPEVPEQPTLGKTLQQLQGKWRLSRQIAEDGHESGMPSQSVWEFKGDRVIVRDSGPGAAMLIEVDDSQSPVHVKMTIEIDEESGLGLLSLEGDKVIFCLGKRQKTPDPHSRPEKLQWVAGVFYMELIRMKPGETVVPSKPSVVLPMERSSVVLPMNESAISPLPVAPSERHAVSIDHGNARSVVEAYVASALAKNIGNAVSLAKNSPADPKRIRELPEYLNVQRLKIETVYINDPAKPTQALATSVAVKLDEEHKQPDGRRVGFMVLTLEFTDDKWFVIDIDFQTESGAEKELNKFLKANPNSIGIPPQS